jgi:hypothetical protein
MTFVHFCVGFVIAAVLLVVGGLVAWLMSFVGDEEYSFGIYFVWFVETVVIAGFITYTLFTTGLIGG